LLLSVGRLIFFEVYFGNWVIADFSSIKINKPELNRNSVLAGAFKIENG